MSIVIVDSGVANLASVVAALKRLNVDAHITSDATKIRSSSHVILPGVGTASAAMTQLRDKNLIEILRGLTQPVLGICLGMQILFTHSEEGDGVACLNIIPGEVKKLPAAVNKPIPHMGWNQIQKVGSAHSLLRDVPDNCFVYFVHSFAAPLGDYTLASCDYSQPFTAIAQHKNFYGCQFHPERSSVVGNQILKNFLEL